MEQVDVIVIGAGAAGMMCAAEAGRRGRRVLLLDHNRAPGEKIRISGGGRCNFTNLHCAPGAFISQNPKFAISALSRFSQWDFIERIERHGISWHEKTLGQLFCDGSARQVVEMLTGGLRAAGVTLRLGVSVRDVRKTDTGFALVVSGKTVRAAALVIACGGASIPKMGASTFGYGVARRFGLEVVEPAPALVPLTFAEDVLSRLRPLAGLSLDAAVFAGGKAGVRFHEGLLFTHRGLSGPSILQASSYWRAGQEIVVDLLPGRDAAAVLEGVRKQRGAQRPARALAAVLPKRLATLLTQNIAAQKTLADLNRAELGALSGALGAWRLEPTGTEGYRTAEVTRGGVSTAALEPRTMQARTVRGLYFIGEVVDVTGWLGGYNFQWAWSSGWAAGQVV